MYQSIAAASRIALAPRDGTELDQLIKNADLAMYAAKSGGRRTYRFFEAAMGESAKARLTMEQDLRQATGDETLQFGFATNDRARMLDLEGRPLDEVAALVAGAAVVVGVDTGLLHVAAALGVPLVGIFIGSWTDLSLFQGPLAQIAGSAGPLPLAVSVDEEGGRVSRLRSLIVFRRVSILMFTSRY